MSHTPFCLGALRTFYISFGPLTLTPVTTVGNNTATFGQGGGVVVDGAQLRIEKGIITPLCAIVHYLQAPPRYAKKS